MHERVAVARRPGDPAATLLPLPRFIAGFTLITIAFPFGRTSVMGCFSKVLGPTPQGTWIGEPPAALLRLCAVPAGQPPGPAAPSGGAPGI